MNTNEKTQRTNLPAHLTSVEKIQNELATAESIDDFFGKDGIFARLFANTIEAMKEKGQLLAEHHH